ncbi:MAG: hypothetical protein HRU76_10355 [Phycisphaeraceae bacterium]|nr:hypothetical protein [Phycisphaerales bacterium]QOJ17960.1 MAG: hypothetical protein HRU76_10355 [Phycisphaeraceae bacterium]
MRGTNRSSRDSLEHDALCRFAALVESVGIKRFAASMGLSTRQVNRILSGAQPNPIERLIRSLQSADVDAGDQALDYICQEMGGHFVRMEAVDMAAVNAVRECAEAIVAISDGQISELDINEVREAISALTALSMTIKNQRRGPDDRKA